MIHKTITVLTIAILVLIIQSCALSSSIPKDVSESFKNQRTPDGKAMVYIYRTSALGFAVGLNVSINDKLLASFYTKNFFVCTLDPGKYIFSAKSENDEDLILNLKPNVKYYVEVTPMMGNLYARVELNIHDEIDGSKGVQKCKMIGSSNTIQPLTTKTTNQVLQSVNLPLTEEYK